MSSALQQQRWKIWVLFPLMKDPRVQWERRFSPRRRFPWFWQCWGIALKLSQKEFPKINGTITDHYKLVLFIAFSRNPSSSMSSRTGFLISPDSWLVCQNISSTAVQAGRDQECREFFRDVKWGKECTEKRCRFSCWSVQPPVMGLSGLCQVTLCHCVKLSAWHHMKSCIEISSNPVHVPCFSFLLGIFCLLVF